MNTSILIIAGTLLIEYALFCGLVWQRRSKAPPIRVKRR